jgi:subtilisin family serine protease
MWDLVHPGNLGCPATKSKTQHVSPGGADKHERTDFVKRTTAAICVATLALAAFVPINAATAEDLAPVDTTLVGSKAVVESESGSYVVVMGADPLVSTVAPDDLSTAAAEAQSDALDASHDAVLAEAGVSTNAKVQDFTNALNGFSAVLGYNEAVKLAANPKVSVVLPDELRQLTSVESDGSEAIDGSDGHGHDGVSRSTDDLGDFLGLTAKGEAWKSGLTGEGVVVGVIDTGIWPEHPSFADDGTFPPHDPLSQTKRSSCDFGNTKANPDDAPFVCNNKLIGARLMLDTYKKVVPLEPDEFISARDDEGHGTHTASTAAGDANVPVQILGRTFPKVSGIAPRAPVIAYKVFGNHGGFTSDTAAAVD